MVEVDQNKNKKTFSTKKLQKTFKSLHQAWWRWIKTKTRLPPSGARGALYNRYIYIIVVVVVGEIHTYIIVVVVVEEIQLQAVQV